MNALQILDQREVFGNEFRIYGDVETPLFLAKDVATWIEHSNPSVMLQGVEDSEKVLNNVYTLGGSQEAWFLTEDGLYEVLMQSRKPIAKTFKKKVKEILKDIRKHGMYATDKVVDAMLEDPDAMITVLTKYKEEKAQRLRLQEEAEHLQQQLDEAHNWFTIKRVSQINDIDWHMLDWRTLKRTSIVMNRQIQKIFDANFGEVNLYHVDVFRAVYPELKYK